MDTLLPLAKKVADLLKTRGETIAVGESSVGGLVSASLIAQAGASAFYVGGTIIYTPQAGRVLRAGAGIDLKGQTPLTPGFVEVLADGFRRQMGTDWATAEMGAAGPSGSPYGPGPGTGAVAVAGPVLRGRLVETGSADRMSNMRSFGQAKLELLIECLEEAGR
ncbi:MAG: CinA family protein [Parvibaculum sp.]